MDYKVLSGIPLFRSVPEREIERILSELTIKELRFGKGEMLAMQNEICNRLIILLSGSVKGEMIDVSGKLVKVEDIYAPSPLAILFLFGKNNRFPVQIITREEVKVCIIPRQSVVKMLGMNETLLKNYLDISADFAFMLSRKLHFMSFRSIKEKIATYLLELSDKQKSDTISFDRTKTSLAEYFGISRQSLEREISHMQKEGLLISGNKSIKINDRKSLMKIIGT